jgi:ribosomal peptide maturation radical SAM protein 1
MKDFGIPLGDADVLIIVPPFAALESPSLAAHLLQACGRRAGFEVRVLYASMLFAAVVGEERYSRVCYAPTGEFIGERLFARCAYGIRSQGNKERKAFVQERLFGIDNAPELALDFFQDPIDFAEFKSVEESTVHWADRVAQEVSKRTYKIVGCTTTFEQTTASVALLNRIKSLCAEVITILGGANCTGEMAQGIASLGAGIDYIFSGESESTFPEFVRDLLAGRTPQSRLIYGESCRDMDTLPTPVFNEYYEQRSYYLPESKENTEETLLPYETSRGCWWGQKYHCTFCGLNGEGMTFRQKSPDRVIEELQTLLNTHHVRRIHMTDNIMPHEYFKTLVPRLAEELPGLRIFYEQKANLSLHQVLQLKSAGISFIQPGIEALSSRLLRRMKKGVLARQNLMLLRYAKAVGLHLAWNLLWGFPGDEREAYEETLSILPLLHHLQPPGLFTHISIDRFSPYFFQPTEFGIQNVRPLQGYFEFLPHTANVQRIAYHFEADYYSGAHEHLEVIRQVGHELKKWNAAWQQEEQKPPGLQIGRFKGYYLLLDTRCLPEVEKLEVLDREEAAFLLTARPATGGEQEEWALRKKLAVLLDGWFVPLAIAAPDMLLEFEKEQGALRG